MNYTDQLLAFLQSPVFQSLGLTGLFIYSILPAFIAPLPNETISVPLMIGGTSPIVIIIVMSIGSLLGDILIYYLGIHARRFFKKEKPKEAKLDHFMHKHRYWIFTLAVPIPYLSEAVMVIAGHEHINLKKVLPFIYAGELIRAIIGTFVAIGILHIPSLF